MSVLGQNNYDSAYFPNSCTSCMHGMHHAHASVGRVIVKGKRENVHT